MPPHGTLARIRQRIPADKAAGPADPNVGTAPAWMGVPGGEEPASLTLPPDTLYVDGGWRTKVIWVVEADQPDPVRVMGSRVGGGEPPRIEIASVARPEVVLDPAGPAAASGPETADFPSNVYFPEAGCYAFEAT